MTADPPNPDNLPGNWESGIGEAARPLSDDGYYQHPYYRPLPGSNQFTDYFLEMTVDTANMPPTEHVIELYYCVEDDEEIRWLDHLERETVPVEHVDDDGAQSDAEHRAFDRAVQMMIQYKDWQPPFLR